MQTGDLLFTKPLLCHSIYETPFFRARNAFLHQRSQMDLAWRN